MTHVKAPREESRFLTPAVVVIFCALALFMVFFLTGEARRARLLAEYEADRAASALLEAYRSDDALDESALDPRVLAFGVYRSGEPVLRLRAAPPSLPGAAAPGFTYDRKTRSLLLIRPLGMGMLEMPGASGMQRMMRRGYSGMRAPGWSGSILLSLDARGYYRSRMLYGIGAVGAPFLVAGIAALFLSLAAANRRYRKAAEDRDVLARLGEVAHTLAHEIRNPLGAIRIQTGLLRKGAPPSTHLDIIDEEVSRLNLLSRRVGDFLRDPRGNPERIRLGAFVRELLPRFPWPVDIRTDAESDEVLFDRDLLRSVIENLVRNAHESYGEEAARGPRDVVLALGRQAERVVLSVLDRGKGIPLVAPRSSSIPL